MTLWKHKVRGTTYEELFIATLQNSDPHLDDSAIVIYKGQDGRVWARFKDEFHDGRFELVNPHVHDFTWRKIRSSYVHDWGEYGQCSCGLSEPMHKHLGGQ